MLSVAETDERSRFLEPDLERCIVVRERRATLKHDLLLGGWAAAFHVQTKFMCQSRNARQRKQREFIAVRRFRRLVLDSNLLLTRGFVLDSGSPLEMWFGSGLRLLCCNSCV